MRVCHHARHESQIKRVRKKFIDSLIFTLNTFLKIFWEISHFLQNRQKELWIAMINRFQRGSLWLQDCTWSMLSSHFSFIQWIPTSLIVLHEFWTYKRRDDEDDEWSGEGGNSTFFYSLRKNKNCCTLKLHNFAIWT